MNDQRQLIAEIINLEAILNLPKGTEHFVSDLHGEFDAFDYSLRSGSGSIHNKVHMLFGHEMSQEEMNELCLLIYYPEEKIRLIKKETTLTSAWWEKILYSLIAVVRFSANKYTRSKVRKAFPTDHAYILEELIYPYDETRDKEAYYHQIIRKIITLQTAEILVIELAQVIQRLVIDHLHVIGDIYDRGPFPDKIIDRLMTYHSVDIQWGNHDIIWLGAFSGSKACLANVLRICARYGNLDLLEKSYGITLDLLKKFSRNYYHFNSAFQPKQNPYRQLTEQECDDSMYIQQAMTIIQQKIEGQLILRRPEFKQNHRLLLDKIQNQTLYVRNKEYPLIHACFQTVNPQEPYQLTQEEEEVVTDLLQQFQQSEKLLTHLSFLIEKGSLYSSYNQNLLIHGCIPLNPDGTFQAQTFQGKKYAGKALFDYFDTAVRYAFYHREYQTDYATDVLWYLWCGETSSLFGKKAMKTFERYFIGEKETHIEEKNAYYQLRNHAIICQKILTEFDLTTAASHIINGHTPIKRTKGESPIKANGTLLVIDGGFSKTYQPITGIGGYTLLFNSFGLQLATHKPFTTKEAILATNQEIISTRQIASRTSKRLKVRDTTVGKELLRQISILEKHVHIGTNKA